MEDTESSTLELGFVLFLRRLQGARCNRRSVMMKHPDVRSQIEDALKSEEEKIQMYHHG